MTAELNGVLRTQLRLPSLMVGFKYPVSGRPGQNPPIIRPLCADATDGSALWFVVERSQVVVGGGEDRVSQLG